ncbi:hypothetical protein H6F79_14715 [Trichocoleus sp. FACHB-69]|nr:hypothetical protein [Trichocoleus sp. FACHB-69]
MTVVAATQAQSAVFAFFREHSSNAMALAHPRRYLNALELLLTQAFGCYSQSSYKKHYDRPTRPN